MIQFTNCTRRAVSLVYMVIDKIMNHTNCYRRYASIHYSDLCK